jgi:hypothetical protein
MARLDNLMLGSSSETHVFGSPSVCARLRAAAGTGHATANQHCNFCQFGTLETPFNLDRTKMMVICKKIEDGADMRTVLLSLVMVSRLRDCRSARRVLRGWLILIILLCRGYYTGVRNFKL